MADLTRMDELIVKRLLGKITPEETKELLEMAQESEENRQYIDRMSPQTFRKKWRAAKGIDYDRIIRLTREKTSHIPGAFDWMPKSGKERKLLPYSIAASILLLAGAALWLSQRSRTSEPGLQRAIGATITWQSGTGATDSLVLRNMKEDTAYPAGAVQIARIKNQVFVFPWRDTATASKDTLAYRLNVDGKQDIQVFLPFTTKTMLSPSSSLSFTIYPPGTEIKEIQIACDGEALFDIDHNYQIPTIIKSLKQEITVLGTLFKVRDFKAEDTSAVFCYHGKVSVKDSARVTTILDSAQRATVKPGGKIKVSKNDFPNVNWSSPDLIFDFSNDDLETAMKQIARWYGMSKVIFEEPVDRRTRGMVFTGELSRYLSLQQLLSIIERDDLHFSIKGDTIVVRGRDRHL